MCRGSSGPAETYLPLFLLLPVKAGRKDGCRPKALLCKEGFLLSLLVALPSSLQFSIAAKARLDGGVSGSGPHLLLLLWRRLLLLRRNLLLIGA